nr:uncharacterized protein LOC109169433 [Ipomoea batatas]
MKHRNLPEKDKVNDKVVDKSLILDILELICTQDPRELEAGLQPLDLEIERGVKQRRREHRAILQQQRLAMESTSQGVTRDTPEQEGEHHVLNPQNDPRRAPVQNDYQEVSIEEHDHIPPQVPSPRRQGMPQQGYQPPHEDLPLGYQGQSSYQGGSSQFGYHGNQSHQPRPTVEAPKGRSLENLFQAIQNLNAKVDQVAAHNKMLENQFSNQASPSSNKAIGKLSAYSENPKGVDLEVVFHS